MDQPDTPEVAAAKRLAAIVGVPVLTGSPWSFIRTSEDVHPGISCDVHPDNTASVRFYGITVDQAERMLRVVCPQQEVSNAETR